MRPILMFAAAAVAGWLAAAPPVSAQTTPAVVHPLAEILVGNPRFTDLMPNSVTVEIDTKVPVVCAVVYGTTTAYGAIATDSDMAGGAHTMHHPALRGLQPNTLYQLRMQGVGADGTLYVSDNFTLRTPVALASTKPNGKNVALASAGATIRGVSSNYGGGSLSSTYGGLKAIDGDPASEWSSDG